MTISQLIVDGVTLPTPAKEGVAIGTEKIWSADTGRVASGMMHGTIVGIKKTVKMKFPPLTPVQVKQIESVVSTGSAFHNLRFTDLTGTTTTINCYFSSTSGTWSSWVEGMQYINGYEVDAIER